MPVLETGSLISTQSAGPVLLVLIWITQDSLEGKRDGATTKAKKDGKQTTYHNSWQISKLTEVLQRRLTYFNDNAAGIDCHKADFDGTLGSDEVPPLHSKSTNLYEYTNIEWVMIREAVIYLVIHPDEVLLISFVRRCR